MIIASIIVGTVILLFIGIIGTTIKELNNDKKWWKYNEAWHDWRISGKGTKMPIPEDFGYKVKR